MADERGPTLTSWRKVADVDGVQISIRYDCGNWVLQSGKRGERGFEGKEIDMSPAAMDALVAAWPNIRSKMP